MEQNFDLNKMGLAPMSETEMQEIDGGKLPWYEIGAVAFGIAAVLFTGGMALAAGGAAVCCAGLSN
jgi:hypothetical protein